MRDKMANTHTLTAYFFIMSGLAFATLITLIAVPVFVFMVLCWSGLNWLTSYCNPWPS